MCKISHIDALYLYFTTRLEICKKTLHVTNISTVQKFCVICGMCANCLGTYVSNLIPHEEHNCSLLNNWTFSLR